MTYKLIIGIFALSLFFSCTKDREFDNIDPDSETNSTSLDNALYYWNFNDVDNLLTPDYSVSTPTLTYEGNYYDEVDEASTINARDNDVAGYALRLRNPSGDFIIKVPTTNYKEIVVKYAICRTSKGSQSEEIYYSTDGNNYTQDGLETSSYTIYETYKLITLDFSAISAVNDNSNFTIKITFDAGSSSSEKGNNRMDNLTVEGNTI